MSPRHVATCLQNVFVTCLGAPLEDTKTRDISNQVGSLYVQNINTNVTALVAGLVSMTENNVSSLAHLQNIQRASVGKTENESKPKVSY